MTAKRIFRGFIDVRRRRKRPKTLRPRQTNSGAQTREGKKRSGHLYLPLLLSFLFPLPSAPGHRRTNSPIMCLSVKGETRKVSKVSPFRRRRRRREAALLSPFKSRRTCQGIRLRKKNVLMDAYFFTKLGMKNICVNSFQTVDRIFNLPQRSASVPFRFSPLILALSSFPPFPPAARSSARPSVNLQSGKRFATETL